MPTHTHTHTLKKLVAGEKRPEWDGTVRVKINALKTMTFTFYFTPHR